jgi:uncharacterized protein (TIGR00730 family)
VFLQPLLVIEDLAMQSICVYCGSSDKMPDVYLQAASEMGKTIAEHGLLLIYGAGSTGLMGALADAALQAGGEVLGIIPQYFNTPVLAHPHLTKLEIVDTLHQRKARMVELADAFIALPGGYGTWEELFEVLTWAQIGLHQKPIGLLNTHGYYNIMLTMIEQAQREGFIYDEHRALFEVKDQPVSLLEALNNHLSPSGLERWLTRGS